MRNSLAMQQFKKTYQDDALEMEVYGASPVGLIVLLYEGAIRAINQAKVMMQQQQFAEKGRLINKAIDIIEGLRVVLDHEHGKEISKNLEDLYVYSKYRLGVANVKNDTGILDEVANLLGVILPSWKELAKNPHAAPAQPGVAPRQAASL